MIYKSLEIKPAKLDETINALAREDWRLVSVIPSMEQSGTLLRVLAVFERSA